MKRKTVTPLKIDVQLLSVSVILKPLSHGDNNFTDV